MGMPDISRPIPDSLIHRVFKGLTSAIYRDYPGPEQFHPKDIQLLPVNVLLAHKDIALQSKHRRHRSRGHTVLTGSGLSNKAAFIHPQSQQCLADGIVDFMGSGMQEIFALKVDCKLAA